MHLLDRVSWVAKLSGRRLFGTVVDISADQVTYSVKEQRTGMVLPVRRSNITKECG